MPSLKITEVIIDLMGKAQKFTKIVFMLIAIWMIATNFVSWKTTFFANSNIKSTMLAGALDNLFGPRLSMLYGLISISNKEDIIQRLTIRNDEIFLTIPLNTKPVPFTNIEMISPELDGLLISGWVFIPSKLDTVKFVVAVLEETIVGAGEVDKLRIDVATALEQKSAELSGFSFPIPHVNKLHKCDLKIYALTQAMHIYPIPFHCDPTPVINDAPPQYPNIAGNYSIIFDLSKKWKDIEIKNAIKLVSNGEVIKLKPVNDDPMILFKTGDSKKMNECKSLEISAFIRASQLDNAQLYFKVLGQLNYIETFSKIEPISVVGNFKKIIFNINSQSGFIDELRLDPVKTSQQFEIKELEVRCMM